MSTEDASGALSGQAATNTTDWQVAGLQHEIFLRVLPAVRHDMLGPVSVARMDVAILKRKLAAEAPDLPACQERLLTLDGHLSGVSHALGLLRRWDTARGDTAGAGETLALAIGLMAPLLRLREITLAPFREDVAPALGEVQRPQSAFLYACLALLCHAQDHLPAGSRVSMELTADGATMAHAPSPPGETPRAAGPLAPVSGRRIDRAGAETLTSALGYRTAWAEDHCELLAA